GSPRLAPVNAIWFPRDERSFHFGPAKLVAMADGAFPRRTGGRPALAMATRRRRRRAGSLVSCVHSRRRRLARLCRRSLDRRLASRARPGPDAAPLVLSTLALAGLDRVGGCRYPRHGAGLHASHFPRIQGGYAHARPGACLSGFAPVRASSP